MSAPNERARRSQAPPPSSRHPSMPPGADSHEAIGSSVPSRFDNTISRTTLPRNTDINPFEVQTTSQREQLDTRTPTFRLHTADSLRQPYHGSRLWASPSDSDTMITPSRTTGYDPSGRMSRLGTFSTDEGLGSEPSDHDQSFDAIQYNEPEDGPVSVQRRREEQEGNSTRRAEGSSRPYPPNYPYSGTVQEGHSGIWRSGEPPLSSSTPTPVPPSFIAGSRATPTSNYSQDVSFEATTDSAPSSSYPYNDLGRRVADLQRRTMVSLSDIMGESQDEAMNESVYFPQLPSSAGLGPVPGPGAAAAAPIGIARSAGASTTDRSYPNPFLTQETEPRPSNPRAREEERRDLYRDEDIGMELDQLTAPAAFLRRRKSMTGSVDEDYGGSVLHKEARLDPGSFKASGEYEGAGSFSRVAMPSTHDLIDELRRVTYVQLTTPDELERRTWMYEDGGRIGKVQRLGLWQH